VLGEFSARDIAKVADGAGCLKAVACLQVMANPLLVGEFAHSEKLLFLVDPHKPADGCLQVVSRACSSSFLLRSILELSDTKFYEL